jgi:hypothetical protein
MTDLTRRGALALLGALAGCSTTPFGGSDSDRTELDGAAIRALVDDSAPTVPDRLPVSIGDDHLDATADRARTLLGSVPADLGPDDVPNGEIRHRVAHARDHAEEAFARARETPAAHAYERLAAFADARADARFAAGAWRAIDADLTRDDLTDEADAVRRDRRAVRERRRYVADDPVPATLVHAAIERRVDDGRADASTDGPGRYRRGNPLGVGELAEEVERARVAVDDAAHLYDRLTGSLEDPTDLRPRLHSARERLRADFDAERDDLPAVDAERPWQVEGVDVEDTPAAEALRDLYRSIDPEYDDGWADAPPARSLLRAHRSFITLRAFASLRSRVADGETFAVESADDVATIRTAAVDAVRTAADDPSPLTHAALSDTADRLRHADDRLAAADDDVTAIRIRREVARYLVVTARARATPDASERVAEALRSA